MRSFLVLFVSLALAAGLSAQIFVVYAGSQTNGGVITAYNLDGSLANASLITGVNYPTGLTQSGGNLFVVRNGDITVSKYTTAGTTVSSALFTPSNYPGSITASEDGTRLFISTTDFNSQAGKIEEYTAAGGLVNATLVTGLGRLTTIAEGGGNLFFANNGPINVYTTGGALVTNDLLPGINGLALAVSGSTLFVSDGNTIGKYTTVGGTVNATFLTGFPDYVTDLAVAGGALYILNRNHGTIGAYNLDGTTINAALITGLNASATVYGFAIAIPEPSTYAAILGAVALGGVMIRRRRAA